MAISSVTVTFSFFSISYDTVVQYQSQLGGHYQTQHSSTASVTAQAYKTNNAEKQTFRPCVL